jgi:hypothetical protein
MFIQTLFDLLVIASSIFLVVKATTACASPVEVAVRTPEDVVLLREISDSFEALIADEQPLRSMCLAVEHSGAKPLGFSRERRDLLQKRHEAAGSYARGFFFRASGVRPCVLRRCCFALLVALPAGRSATRNRISTPR